MRALVCESWREFDALELKEVPPPALRPGGVRIRVEAAGVSFATQLVVAGKYQRKPPLPFTPGTEIAGTVIESAPDVPDPLPPGTRVFAVLDWGGLAEEAVADAIHVMPIPDGLPLAPAVAMPISYPTAASALLWRARLAPDQGGPWVLVHGAAAGVGLAGVEIAKALGARVIARCGAAKRAVPEARGADLVLDSAAPFREAVREATGGAGVAALLDTLGAPVFEDNLRCLGDGGMMVTIGFAAGGIPSLPLNLLLLKNIAVAGVNWGTYVGWSPGDNRQAHAPRVRALWQRLIDWWAAGALTPEVHASFPLPEFRAAMAEVRGRNAVGRVVLRPGER
ncbi:NADPH:quinone oxidoreductase family protein [Roseicella frigidaeris]|uniref:NADPH:quinone oxidoreductase family protein n=1 Tax=Roseicella frigidaeris TaxID=2230885 RepID=A0A327MBH7_9PROT|nr:NADPH:quinone oxidoreductase family protein [Roseicella frigidaeris]RAI59722.1 NADPH:quinone oxidoreductase family protein [Roseicella frigidaeris]